MAGTNMDRRTASLVLMEHAVIVHAQLATVSMEADRMKQAPYTLHYRRAALGAAQGLPSTANRSKTSTSCPAHRH